MNSGGRAICGPADRAFHFLDQASRVERLGPELIEQRLFLRRRPFAAGQRDHRGAVQLRQLPQLNGATLVALTGREGPSPQEQALFDQFWTKPFDPRRLIEEVKGVINRAADRSPA